GRDRRSQFPVGLVVAAVGRDVRAVGRGPRAAQLPGDRGFVAQVEVLVARLRSRRRIHRDRGRGHRLVRTVGIVDVGAVVDRCTRGGIAGDGHLIDDRFTATGGNGDTADVEPAGAIGAAARGGVVDAAGGP